MREFIGLAVVYIALLVFAILAVPYVCLWVMRAVEWYGTTGAVVFVAGVVCLLAGSLWVWWRNVR